MMKRISIILCGIALLSIGMFFVTETSSTRVNVISSSEYLPLNNLAPALEKELTSLNYHKIVDIYVGNFANQPSISEIKNKNHTNILLLGSQANFNIQQVQSFDFVFSTTYHLHSFLNDESVPNDLLPVFSNDTSSLSAPSLCVTNPKNQGCYFAVIGQQEQVISVLEKENIPYHIFDLRNRQDVEKMQQEHNLISGIITNYSTTHPSSIDSHSFFFEAISSYIPILSDNVMQENFINMNNFNLTSLFFDTLSYYTYESDIHDFLACDDCRIKKAMHAKFLLNTLYTPMKAAKRIAAVLTEKTDTDLHESNVISILTPLHAGLYNNGDYWVADDLAQSLETYYKKAFLVYPTSIYTYIGDILIYFRGTKPLKETKIRPDTVSLMYLAFPFTADKNVEEYAHSMAHEFTLVDGIVSASKGVAEIARKMGYHNVFYLPQFTNIKKFYRDYNPELATDVLFVGRNIYYRTAAQIVYDAGLPITIYGPDWNGIAKAPYVNNRILRQYYSSAKIVLNDAKPDMKRLGFIINRIFDATACGTLVVSDYMPEIEEIYGDSVPMWKTPEELVNLVKYYLDPEHESERLEKAERARTITLQNFTSDIAAQKFKQIIEKIRKEKRIGQ